MFNFFKNIFSVEKQTTKPKIKPFRVPFYIKGTKESLGITVKNYKLTLKGINTSDPTIIGMQGDTMRFERYEPKP